MQDLFLKKCRICFWVFIIHISFKEEAKFYIFSIQDNGIGIVESNKAKVFDLFTRLHTKDEYEGSGIGLAMCKKIVQILGGDIWNESESGVGSTFFFSIPKAPEPILS